MCNYIKVSVTSEGGWHEADSPPSAGVPLGDPWGSGEQRVCLRRSTTTHPQPVRSILQ